MKKLSLPIFLCAFLLLVGCKNENRETSPEMDTDTRMDQTNRDNAQPRSITVNLEPRSGSNLSGNVTFTEENGEVTMMATIEGLSEGLHAIHLHEKADCSAEDGTSAGGHWNPTRERHGKWGDAEGYHKGDIGNFRVESNGTGTITMTTDEWCIGCDDANKNIVGTSVMIHDGVDDFVSQPAGDAGDRVGCGEITM